MNFVEGKIYVDRSGKEYKFLHKVSGVVKFEEIETGKVVVNHYSGKYRWDNQDHPLDIIAEKK